MATQSAESLAVAARTLLMTNQTWSALTAARLQAWAITVEERKAAAMEEANAIARTQLELTKMYDQSLASSVALVAAAEGRAAAAMDRAATAEERLAADAEKN